MFRPITRRLRQWHMRNVTRRKLALLDSRLLADIGASRPKANESTVPLPFLGENP